MNAVLRTTIFLACCTATIGVRAQTTAPATDTARKATDTVKHIVAAPKPIQRQLPPALKPKGPRPITHEASVGFRFNSNGWSGYVDYGRAKAKDVRRIDMYHNVRFLQLEFTEKIDPTEQALVGSGSDGTKYRYGKINKFYGLKLGYGFRKLIIGKPEPGTVSIHWVNVLGATLGLQKPYYINVGDVSHSVKYSDATANEFLTQQGNIVGRAPFKKGLDEMKFIPGGHFKSALHFDFAVDRKNLMAVETGFNVEYYSSPVQLMAGRDGVPYFFDLFVAIQVGKRW